MSTTLLGAFNSFPTTQVNSRSTEDLWFPASPEIAWAMMVGHISRDKQTATSCLLYGGWKVSFRIGPSWTRGIGEQLVPLFLTAKAVLIRVTVGAAHGLKGITTRR